MIMIILSNEDLIVACHLRLISIEYGNRCLGFWEYCTLAHLKAMAEDRKSQFLFCILCMRQHLNESNIAILAKTCSFTSD